jgi:hypothetical protein
MGSNAEYQRLWYWKNRERVCAYRRDRYARCMDPKRRKRARKPNQEKEVRALYREFLDFLKAAPCADCRGTFPPVAMDFDHVRGTKRFTLGTAGHRKPLSILAEVGKCDIVCANCHRVRTQARKLAVI